MRTARRGLHLAARLFATRSPVGGEQNSTVEHKKGLFNLIRGPGFCPKARRRARRA